MDEMRIKKILQNSNNKNSPEDIKFLAISLTREMLEKEDINAHIAVRKLDDDCYARHVGAISINKDENGKITNRSINHIINFNENKLSSDLFITNQEKNIPGIVDFLHGIGHEIQHASRSENYTKEPIDYNAILIAKESICRNKYRGFYTKNYDALASENDAEIQGWYRAVEVLKKYDPNLLQAYKEEINEIIQELKEKDSNSKIILITEKDRVTGERSKVISYGVDKVIRENPEEMMGIYPILHLEYNKDGSKKTYEQLMEDKEKRLIKLNEKENIFVQGEEMNKEEAIEKMYEGIINSDDVLQKQSKKANKDESKQNYSETPEKENRNIENPENWKEGIRYNLSEDQQKEIEAYVEDMFENSENEIDEVENNINEGIR